MVREAAFDDRRAEGFDCAMEPNFKAAEFSRLTPSERVKWCRQMAAEADRLAEAASPRVRSAYLELARQWTALAEEIERELARNV